MAAPQETTATGIDAVLRELLQASFGLYPDELEAVIAESVERHTGAHDMALLLVDLDQIELRRLGGGAADGDVLAVDDSLAGLAFREERPVVERLGSSRRLWLPVLDSAERLGVLRVVDDGATSIDDWLVLTSLIGELVTSKHAYGDTIARARRRSPVSVAAEMRWAMLPPLTFTSPEVTITGIAQPSHLVAGDAFDYAVDRESATIALFDAMGHGLEASRIANLAVGCFVNGRRQGREVDELFATIDETIASEIGGSRFSTCLLAHLDLGSGSVRVHSAGHLPPVVLRRSGQIETVAVKPRPPLGLGPQPCEPTDVRLEPGDALLMHSDGVSEARSPSDEVFGAERTAALAQSLLGDGVRPAEVLRRVMREAIDHQQGRVRDDATLALVRWRPSVVDGPGVPTAADALEVGST